MEPRIHTVTLGVSNLETSVAFYRDVIGWHTAGIVGAEFGDAAVAIFDMTSGSRLQLFSKAGLAREAKLALVGNSSTEFSLGYYVHSQTRVDEVIQRIRDTVQAVVTKEPGTTSWGGYNAYFQDIDSHLWEVVWDPKLTIKE